MSDEKTIFKKIIDGEIPANKVYEDDLCLAFHDVAPQAPTHVLLIPKKEVVNVAALSEEDRQLAGHLLLAAGNIARELGDNARAKENEILAALDSFKDTVPVCFFIQYIVLI